MGLTGCVTFGRGCPAWGFAAFGLVAGAVLVSGKMYSDSICAACSGVGCALFWADAASFLPQPLRANTHNPTKMNGCFIGRLSSSTEPPPCFDAAKPRHQREGS